MQASSGGKGEKKPRLPAAERHPASQGGYQRGARSRPSPHSGESNLCANIVSYLLAPPLTAGRTLSGIGNRAEGYSPPQKEGRVRGGKVRGGQIQVQC